MQGNKLFLKNKKISSIIKICSEEWEQWLLVRGMNTWHISKTIKYFRSLFSFYSSLVSTYIFLSLWGRNPIKGVDLLITKYSVNRRVIQKYTICLLHFAESAPHVPQEICKHLSQIARKKKAIYVMHFFSLLLYVRMNLYRLFQGFFKFNLIQWFDLMVCSSLPWCWNLTRHYY